MFLFIDKTAMDDESSIYKSLMKQWTTLQNDKQKLNYPNDGCRIPGALAPTNQKGMEPRVITLFLDLNG